MPTVRPATEGDYEDWEEAARRRDETPPAKRDREALRRYLKSKNSFRFSRMERDLRWARRKLKKIGLNPEDVPWLL